MEARSVLRVVLMSCENSGPGGLAEKVSSNSHRVFCLVLESAGQGILWERGLDTWPTFLHICTEACAKNSPTEEYHYPGFPSFGREGEMRWVGMGAKQRAARPSE